jgi:hypothetical protein
VHQPFCNGCFWVRDSGYARAGLDHKHLISASPCCWDDRHPGISWDGDLVDFLPRLASNCDSPYLHLLRRYDYRHEPPHPARRILEPEVVWGWAGAPIRQSHRSRISGSLGTTAPHMRAKLTLVFRKLTQRPPLHIKIWGSEDAQVSYTEFSHNLHPFSHIPYHP